MNVILRVSLKSTLFYFIISDEWLVEFTVPSFLCYLYSEFRQMESGKII